MPQSKAGKESSGSGGEPDATQDVKGGETEVSRHTKARARILRILRISCDMKLQEVADQVPCDVATLSRRERGVVSGDEDFDLQAFDILGGVGAIRRLMSQLQDVLDWISVQSRPAKLA